MLTKGKNVMARTKAVTAKKVTKKVASKKVAKKVVKKVTGKVVKKTDPYQNDEFSWQEISVPLCGRKLYRPSMCAVNAKFIYLTGGNIDRIV